MIQNERYKPSDSTIQNSPWHERKTRFEDERRYSNLIEVHGLTHAWLAELSPSADSEKLNLHKIQRILRPELAQSLWLLEKIKLDQLPPILSSLIDGNSASELLDELEETIWIVQSTTLENAIETSRDREGLLNLLEKVSWHYGRKIAEKRWPKIDISQPVDCFQAFQDSPLSTPQGFLLESHHDHECSFYWIHSPLSKKSLLQSQNVLELCRIYHEFMRGFFYTISRNIRLSFTPATLGKLKTFKITLEKNQVMT